MNKDKDIMNLPHLLENRKRLRNNSTSAESTLWRLLKGKQIENLKFRRQHSAGPYILDFYCPEIRLAIELDGEVHNNSKAIEYDEKRSEYLLKEKDIVVLRFENQVVFKYQELIINGIKDNLYRRK